VFEDGFGPWRSMSVYFLMLPSSFLLRTQNIDKNVRIQNRQDGGIIRCASPICKPIADKLSFTIRKRKYFEEKTTATLKIKQTSIATVRNHILTVACFTTPLPFHYTLLLKLYSFINIRKKLCYVVF
jgi:hypothetical protein